MEFAQPALVIAMAAVAGLTVVAAALLRGWYAWLRLKERELERAAAPNPAAPGPARPGFTGTGPSPIELADIKERIRKLEAIANGVDP